MVIETPKRDALACIGRYFADPDGSDAGAAVLNALTTSILRKRGNCRLTGADFVILGKALVLFDVPGDPADDAADRERAEEVLAKTDKSLDEPERKQPPEFTGHGRGELRDPPAPVRRGPVVPVPASPPPAGGTPSTAA